jgi:hypothetical protein
MNGTDRVRNPAKVRELTVEDLSGFGALSLPMQ